VPRGLERDVLPRRYGKYELLERIGEGGMAEAYRARLPGAAGFEKTVVIKRILPHLAENPRFVKMFVNEAKLASRIQHQNVVQVFELDQSPDGELYMVLEHVAGLDLRAILEMAAERVLRLPLWFSVYTLHRVLSGLAHAHELIDEAGERLSIIHRDVTPSNVFVSWLGEVKIADFGVAKAIGSVEVDATDTTLRGQLKGKLSYAPPEQIHGEELDARADVFSAGVVLWECLTQRRLFGGRADFETMLAICEEPRTPPSAFNPAVPPELDAIVLRALERDRQQRHGSAHELAEDLEQALGLLRSRVVPGDVRHVLEVLRGKKPLHPELGADLPDERRESDPVPLLKRRRTSSDPAPASDRGAAARVAYETGEVWQSEPPPGIVDDLRVATPAPLAEVRRATMTPTLPAELPPRPASRAPSGPRAPAAAPAAQPRAPARGPRPQRGPALPAAGHPARAAALAAARHAARAASPSARSDVHQQRAAGPRDLLEHPGRRTTPAVQAPERCGPHPDRARRDGHQWRAWPGSAPVVGR
jgi:serine/threonine protein kinase